MTLTQEQLLSILQMGITGQPLSFSSESVDWKALFTESIQQSVSLNLFGVISSFKSFIPDEEYLYYFESGCKALVANTRMLAEQKKLVLLLERLECPYVILKGVAAASYYPKPELRSLGDIDFLIHEEDEKRVSDELLKEGFSISHQTDLRHRVFSKPGVRLEMHFQVAGIPEGIIGENVNSFLSSVFDLATEDDDGVGRYNKPSDLHHGLILLLHMQHHMLDKGIGLRHLCDWACFLQRTIDEPFWKTRFLPFLKEIGLLTYAIVMSKVCSIYLHTPCPDWAFDAEEETCSAIIEDILSGGNFGRKDRVRKESGAMISQNGKSKVCALVSTMRRSVLSRYPKASKNKIIYVICFLYRTFLYLISTLFGKRAWILKSVDQAARREKLYGELHIFEVIEK